MEQKDTSCCVSKTDTSALLGLIDELRREEYSDGFTTAEMSAETGYSEEWCRKKLGVLINKGKAMYSGKRQRLRIDGVPQWVPVYKLVD